MPLLPALRTFFTRLLTDVDDALFPQHVFCLTCGALSLPNAICPACLAVLDDLRLPCRVLRLRRTPPLCGATTALRGSWC